MNKTLAILLLAIIASAVMSFFTGVAYQQRISHFEGLPGGHIPDSMAYYTDTDAFRVADTVVVYKHDTVYMTRKPPVNITTVNQTGGQTANQIINK
jgi:hypothetical protein